MILLQIANSQPQTDDALLNWALGILVVIVSGSLVYLVNQVNKKDNLLIELTKDLSHRNERNAELIKEFTMVLIDHSKKLESVADLLITANQQSFQNFKTDVKSTIQDLVLKQKDDLSGK